MKPGAPGGVLIHLRLHGPISVSSERRTDSNPAFLPRRPPPRRVRGPGATGAELVTPSSAFAGMRKKMWVPRIKF